MESATVRRGRFSATTDEKGRFVLWIEERKPEERTPVVVSVEKDGHWRNVSRQYVSAFETTETQVMLHTKRVTNRVDATLGGEMAYRGFTLQLPPNAVQTEGGMPYTGTILLSVEGSTPSDPDFGLRMPGGDFAAIDEGGNDVMLYSYGYLSAEMTTESGEKLELRPEARATLRFFLPYTESLRLDSVPLWHFNENTAVWEQEGWSVRNGSIYEGEVSHFSSWNCDYPVQRGACKGRVIDCNGEPVKGGWARVGQRGVITDSLGNYWAFVPEGITFDAWAAVDTLHEISVLATEEQTLEDLRGRNFEGVAVWNAMTQNLNVYLAGNVPADLRLSIDGGLTWTVDRVFLGIQHAPVAVKVMHRCLSNLHVTKLARPDDCRTLTLEQLNQAKSYNDWIEAFSAAEGVYKLDMNNVRIGDKLELLNYFPCLAKLYARSNQLIDLSESFGNLTNLQNLQIDLNLLTHLPDNFGNLINLQTLWLNENQLTSLPESIGNLTKLQRLSLSKNQLIRLPESIGNLSSLQILNLNGNALTSLPASFSNLADSLIELNLRSNPITVERRAAIQALLPNTTIVW